MFQICIGFMQQLRSHIPCCLGPLFTHDRLDGYSLVVATVMCWCFSLRNEGVAVTMLYLLSSWVPQIPIHSCIVINNQGTITKHKLSTTCLQVDYIWLKLCLLHFVYIVTTSCLHSIYILFTTCIHPRYITLHLQVVRVLSSRYLRVVYLNIHIKCVFYSPHLPFALKHWPHFVISVPMLSTLLKL